MKVKLKNADKFLLLILSAAIPAFYLFCKSNKYASLNTDSLQVLTDTLILFLFFIGIFLNEIIKNRLLSFILLLVISAVSFLVLPETVLLFSPVLFLFWSRPVIKGTAPKSLYVLSFYTQSLFFALGLYLFKTQFFVSFFEHGGEYKKMFLLIISGITLCFIPLFIIVWVYSKKKKGKKTATSKNKTQKIGFRTDVYYLTLVILVFVSFLYFSFTHSFSEDLFRFSVIIWLVTAVILILDMNPKLKSILTKKQVNIKKYLRAKKK